MTDEERMKDLLRRRATVYNTNRVLPMYYSDDDIDFLLALIGERAAAERASIVAWLREQSNNETLRASSAKRYVADLIERGDHARPEPAEEGGG